MIVVYTRDALKSLRKVPAKDARALRDKVEAYADGKPVQAEKLQSRPGYRIRHGNWRAIFEIEDDRLTLIVFRIAHRREAYR